MPLHLLARHHQGPTINKEETFPSNRPRVWQPLTTIRGTSQLLARPRSIWTKRQDLRWTKKRVVSSSNKSNVSNERGRSKRLGKLICPKVVHLLQSKRLEAAMVLLPMIELKHSSSRPAMPLRRQVSIVLGSNQQDPCGHPQTDSLPSSLSSRMELLSLIPRVKIRIGLPLHRNKHLLENSHRQHCARPQRRISIASHRQHPAHTQAGETSSAKMGRLRIWLPTVRPNYQSAPSILNKLMVKHRPLLMSSSLPDYLQLRRRILESKQRMRLRVTGRSLDRRKCGCRQCRRRKSWRD